MTAYRIARRTGDGEILFSVQAEDIAQAARVAAHRLYPGAPRVSVGRITGSVSTAGVWQAYRREGENVASAVGEPFHVS